MSSRGRPRKVPEENPGASTAKSPPAPLQEEKVDKKSTGTKASRSSKVQESPEVRPRGQSKDANCTAEQQMPKATKSGEKKVASRCSAKRDKHTEENPSKDLQSAPENVKKSQRSVSTKTTDPRTKSPEVCLRRSPSDAQSTEETRTTKTANSGEKKTSLICSVERGSSMKANPGKVLQAALEKLKVKKSQRSESAKCVNDIQNKVTEHVKLHLDWCKDINVLKTGSYYENVKICEPDEFDVMLTVRVDRVTLQPFSDDGAFYSVKMKRHTQRHPLDKFLKEDNTIMASEMLKEFHEKVKDAVKALQYNVTLERKKGGCPAVTLHVQKNGRHIFIDFVLALEVHSSWPIFTNDGFSIENWLSKKVKMDQRWREFYLVPKYEGRGTVEKDGIMAKDAWRISFSHVEKYILKNHGNSKTCCEGGQKCCRPVKNSSF
ncbi:cyclic GMP-AMP synthase isoform X2 [Neoarius graeffei]|uniref:cyclic GMP-AMP synthase isoform X2 n=1 Tax=Neoarius graeffei TaxID=443677 RepID=UPI00298CAE87|nr:cyclic GMP-AMP synthase isoform X2 [Neoarius graeffei]